MTRNSSRNTSLSTVSLAVLLLLGLIATALPVHAAVEINETGVFSDTQQAATVTFDKVVCRSNSTAQDIGLPWTCNYVCLSTALNCSSTLQAAFTANTSVLVRKGIYPLDNTSAGILSLCGKNNLEVSGEGIDKTIFYNNGMHINCNTNTSNLYLHDFTTDINGSFNQAINLVVSNPQSQACANCKIERVKLQNATSKFLMQGQFWGGYVRDSIFIDGGLVTGADDVTIANFNPNRCVDVSGNQFIKINSAGGGGLTNGGSYCLDIHDNYFLDQSGTSYSAISMEGQTFGMSDIHVHHNTINYTQTDNSGGHIAIGNSAHPQVLNRIMVDHNTMMGGYVAISGDGDSRNIQVSENMISKANAGVLVYNIPQGAKVFGNTIYNWNILNKSATAATVPCIRLDNTNFSDASNNNCYTDLNQALGSWYGIRLVNAYNNTVIENTIKGINVTANIYTFSTSADYYINNYVYSTLPSCSDNSIFYQRTLTYNNSGTLEKRICVGNSWVATGSATGVNLALSGTLSVVGSINTTSNVNLTGAGSCVYLPGGGKLCGNTTCSSLYSPNGLTVIQSCN